MEGRLRHTAIALAALGLALVPGLARADAIDGTWCYSDGRHLTIEGPKILTPGGSRIEGDYNRHGFAYVVPAREKGAGSKVTMVLIDEETMRLRAGADPQAAVEVWRRCELTA